MGTYKNPDLESRSWNLLSFYSIQPGVQRNLISGVLSDYLGSFRESETCVNFHEKLEYPSGNGTYRFCLFVPFSIVDFLCILLLKYFVLKWESPEFAYFYKIGFLEGWHSHPNFRYSRALWTSFEDLNLEYIFFDFFLFSKPYHL